MTRLALIAPFLVAACAGPLLAPAGGGYRNASVPISSIALFEQSRISGSWHELAGRPLVAGCSRGPVEVSAQGTGIQGGGCFLPQVNGPLANSGPGRMRVGGHEIWVLWVDADYRTMVLGTPDGSFAAVLNRTGNLPGDRAEAARRVLDWNGYDMGGISGL